MSVGRVTATHTGKHNRGDNRHVYRFTVRENYHFADRGAFHIAVVNLHRSGQRAGRLADGIRRPVGAERSSVGISRRPRHSGVLLAVCVGLYAGARARIDPDGFIVVAEIAERHARQSAGRFPDQTVTDAGEPDKRTVIVDRPIAVGSILRVGPLDVRSSANRGARLVGAFVRRQDDFGSGTRGRGFIARYRDLVPVRTRRHRRHPVGHSDFQGGLFVALDDLCAAVLAGVVPRHGDVFAVRVERRPTRDRRAPSDRGGHATAVRAVFFAAACSHRVAGRIPVAGSIRFATAACRQ